MTWSNGPAQVVMLMGNTIMLKKLFTYVALNGTTVLIVGKSVCTQQSNTLFTQIELPS